MENRSIFLVHCHVSVLLKVGGIHRYHLPHQARLVDVCCAGWRLSTVVNVLLPCAWSSVYVFSAVYSQHRLSTQSALGLFLV